MSLTITAVNYLNIGLMLASCLLAFGFPFELFLFSYAVLGPLHYLTEISWLHDRKYFTEARQTRKRKRAHQGWLILVGIAMIALVAGFVIAEGAGVEAKPKWEITFFYLVFVAAALVTVINHRRMKIVTALISLLLLVLFAPSRYYIILAFFLVTIIHVLIFTGSFILYGALKGRSISGLLSLIVFVACTVSFFIYAPDSHAVGPYVKQSYHSFNALNAELLKLLGLGSGTSTAEVYESKNGVTIMRLIAFAYTYHYLNWFSKTSIIKWHKIPRARTAVMIVVWIGALALYANNYDAGMAVLYFVSILHVMLEFPLNHRTFVGIGTELRAIASRRRPALSLAPD